MVKEHLFERMVSAIAAAQECWRHFNGHELVADVLAGTKFKDGYRSQTTQRRRQTRGSPPDDPSVGHTAQAASEEYHHSR
jgi:hypothetical protein